LKLSPARYRITLLQLALLAGALTGWQWLPQIPGISDVFGFMDPFIISSPSRIAFQVWALFTGAQHTPVVWPYLAATLFSTLIGTVCGTVVGCIAGLLLGSNKTALRTLSPFITAFNATPRIAIIPVIVIICGTGTTTSAVTAFFLVVFIVFFSALEGARTVPPQILQNARIFGYGPVATILRLRLPYAIAWTFAVIPNAVSFGLVGVVTAEILTGARGMGSFLVVALNAVQSSLTFGIVVVMATVGATLVGLTTLLRRRVLHWWELEHE
jgi:NitT/TauT family transport system permease protein